MRLPVRLLPGAALLALAACSDATVTEFEAPLAPAFSLENLRSDLGALAFADKSLSVSGEQSCQTCHEPLEGFASATGGFHADGAAVMGAVSGRVGDRKPPTAAYATLTPNFTLSGGTSGG